MIDANMRGSKVNLFALGLLFPFFAVFLFQIADSCSVVESARRLVEVDGTYYSFNQLNSIDQQGGATARFDPVGNRWERVDAAPETAVAAVDEAAVLPLVKCVADDPSLCYQIEGNEKVLQSDDGGGSWKTAWRIPAGRLMFMERANICTNRVNVGPYDLIVTGTRDSHQVVAAFGDEGVVFRKSNGTWERQAVLGARPTPFRATTLLEIFATVPTELGSWLLFVLAYGIGQYVFFLRRFRFIFQPLTAAFLIFMTGSLMLAYSVLNSREISEWGIFLLVCVTYCGPIYLAYRKWAGESYRMADPEKGQRAGWIWMWSTIGLFFGGILLLALWPLGVIPFYGLMAAILLGTAVVVAWQASNRIQRLMMEG